MSLLFESIKLQDGMLFNLELHNNRLNRSRLQQFRCADKVDLQEFIHVPPQLGSGLYKCKVMYSQNIEKVEFIPYTRKPVVTLKLVTCDTIEYDFKWVNRQIFTDLIKDVPTDDILIVKNGFITDTSYSNIVFFDGTNWVTPSTPLLRGTKREQLLNEGRIVEGEIKKTDLQYYSRASLMNALLDIEEGSVIDIQNIF